MSEHGNPVNLKELYNDAYASRLLAREESLRIRPILEYVTLADNAKILDVGCGNGPLAGLLAHRIGEYHGVDFSEAFVAQARRLSKEQEHTNCHFHVADIVEFVDQYPEQFDAVFALDISEHVPDAEWAPIVAAFKRALKPGGIVVVHTPNLDFFVERMKERGILLKQFPEHVAVRTASQNKVFFEHYGFSSIAVRRLPHYNFLKLVHPLSKIPGMGGILSARLLLTATRAD